MSNFKNGDETGPIHVLSVRALSSEQVERLHAVSPRIRVEQRVCENGEQIAAALEPHFEVLYSARGDFQLTNAGSLRWLQTESAGVDHLHGTDIWKSGIAVTSANGAHPQVAEYAIAGLLACAHRFPATFDLQRAGVWSDSDRRRMMPMVLRGRTIGIVGYGAIGRETARLASAVGMRVCVAVRDVTRRRFDGWQLSGTGDADGVLPEMWLPITQLDELLVTSDVVVLAVPLASGTRRLLDAERITRMLPGAVLVNIGRGALVDQDAMIAALESGALGGAVLDVTDPEPLPAGHALWRAPNLILTPHISGMSPNMLDNVMSIFAENLRRYAAGEALLNVVQRELGY
ncbi:MAG: D-2-hydroxyacid dehydrogenase [Chloroflexi bacterium]|nr:D-2-hydroxyacid dehydrogenase [Chloroflexota bacterium]